MTTLEQLMEMDAAARAQQQRRTPDKLLIAFAKEIAPVIREFVQRQGNEQAAQIRALEKRVVALEKRK